MNAKIATRGLSKSYGAVQALQDVSLDIREGEVHAICGDNGAGKSTLIKLIAGVEQPDSGQILVDGAQQSFGSPQAALNAGLATIHQDLALALEMSIFQNVYLGAELTRSIAGLRFLDKRAMRRNARTLMAQLNTTLTDMDMKISRLSGGQRQAVAICRALRWNADVVILDEPTAALGVRETEQVLALIRSLKEAGKTIILISHAMQDVARVADRVTILRSGRVQIEIDRAGLSAEKLAKYVLEGSTAPQA